jgi:hypothetical protein
MRAHQPGSTPIDIPETVPNPAYTPSPAPAPERAPTKVPEKVPEKVISGMAEVTATLAPALPEELRPLLSFEIGTGAVEEIAAKLVAWLTLDDAERERARLALAKEAAHRYSWDNVAEGVIAAAQGETRRATDPANEYSSRPMSCASQEPHPNPLLCVLKYFPEELTKPLGSW